MTARAMSSSASAFCGRCVEELGVGHAGLDQGHPDPGVLVHLAQLRSQPLADRRHRPLGRRVERAGQRPPAGDRAGEHVVARCRARAGGGGWRGSSARRRGRWSGPSSASARATPRGSPAWRRSRRSRTPRRSGRRSRAPPAASACSSSHSVTSQRTRERPLGAAELRRRALRAGPRGGRRAPAGSRPRRRALRGGGADPARGAGDQEDRVIGHGRRLYRRDSGALNALAAIIGRRFALDALLSPHGSRPKRKIRLVVALSAAVLLAVGARLHVVQRLDRGQGALQLLTRAARQLLRAHRRRRPGLDPPSRLAARLPGRGPRQGAPRRRSRSATRARCPTRSADGREMIVTGTRRATAPSMASATA